MSAMVWSHVTAGAWCEARYVLCSERNTSANGLRPTATGQCERMHQKMHQKAGEGASAVLVYCCTALVMQ